MAMTKRYSFARGDCVTVYECMLAHEDGISVAEICRATGLDMHKVIGCVRRLANHGKARAIDKGAKPTMWKTTELAAR